jgi:hypothetical protein
MKNVQVIDGAMNCCYDVFAISNEDFEKMFPKGADVEFIADYIARVGPTVAGIVTNLMWTRRLDKKKLHGIHGTLYYELDFKKQYYPTKKETEMEIG